MRGVSSQTRNNWLIDTGLLLTAILVALSGIYFLYLPVGGLRGGRNPWASVQLVFDRHTWDDLHTWSGVAMIAVAGVHLVLHWPWLVGMSRRLWTEVFGDRGRLNARGRWNLLLDLGVGVSFLAAALSGIYFLFFPGGGRTPGATLLLDAGGWDVVHTWSGVALIALAIVHLAIHWRWVVKVARSMLAPTRRADPGRGAALEARAKPLTGIEREA